MHPIIEALKPLAADCLTVRELQIMLHVDGIPKDAASVGDVADALGLNKPTVSRSVDTLLAHGMIRRRKDQSDRRKVVLSLTAKGLAAVGGVKRAAV